MKNGFSLVELSIVLVILGLLTGGILAGQSLIRAAELRAVGTEYSKYGTVVSAFRDKYFAIPGDFNKAIDFWGAATCPGSFSTPTTSGTTTCNGNGDGIINEAAPWEIYRFWQHLANAGLIEGAYTGVPVNASSLSMTPGVNIPVSRLSGSSWSVRRFGTVSATGDLYDGNYGNVFQHGETSGAGTENATRNLYAEELWNIDTKIDDGIPATGKIMMRGGMSNSCVPNTTIAGATYNLSRGAAKVCQLIVPNAF